MARKSTLPQGATALINAFQEGLPSEKFEARLSEITSNDAMKQRIRRIAARSSEAHMLRKLSAAVGTERPDKLMEELGFKGTISGKKRKRPSEMGPKRRKVFRRPKRPL